MDNLLSYRSHGGLIFETLRKKQVSTEEPYEAYRFLQQKKTEQYQSTHEARASVTLSYQYRTVFSFKDG